MKKILYTIIALAACLSLSQCKPSEYLSVSSPNKMDDSFVTSSVSESFKTLSQCYRTILSVSGGGNYNWNDSQSDCEYYPEYNSGNGRVGFLDVDLVPISNANGQYNNLYTILARAARIAEILGQKEEVTEATGVNDWTQLYGEAWTMWAWAYIELVRHFGDVPFGLENSVVDEGYALTSRFDILDACIAKLKEVESKMYYLGEGGIQAERMSRTFANVMIAEANLLAGDFQTLRTDSNAPYGDVTFVDQIESDDTHKAVYARHPNWKTYYKEAQTYMRKVISGDAKGSATLITSDDRGLGNPFQRGFQYIMDMQVSPESYYEVGNQAPLQSERPYSQGRPSDGATKNAAPCKVFGGIRVIPTAYYQIWEDGDLRWDASAVVTGSDGKGSEAIVTLNSGSRLKGGIGINKWDINKMKNPYVVACRKSGMNFCFYRVPNEMLKLAMVDVMLGETSEATSLLNQLRSRAGLGAVEGTVDEYTVIDETKRECIGEGDVKFMEMRAGKFTELAKAMRSEMKTVIAGLEADGSYTFSNGRTLSNYIWTKLVDLSGEGKAQNTYNRDDSDPALTPGWRGGYDYSTTTSSGAVVGTEHNLAIQGLFEAYMPEGATLTFKKVKASDGTEDVVTLSTDGLTMKDLTDQLNVKSAVNTSGGQELYTSISVSCSNGWTIAPWAIHMVNEQGTLWDYNMLSGIDYCSVPMIYHPLPLTTIQQSKGQITNGYGLPNDA